MAGHCLQSCLTVRAYEELTGGGSVLQPLTASYLQVRAMCCRHLNKFYTISKNSRKKSKHRSSLRTVKETAGLQWHLSTQT